MQGTKAEEREVEAETAAKGLLLLGTVRAARGCGELPARTGKEGRTKGAGTCCSKGAGTPVTEPIVRTTS